jgi:hypothetical protein
MRKLILVITIAAAAHANATELYHGVQADTYQEVSEAVYGIYDAVNSGMSDNEIRKITSANIERAATEKSLNRASIEMAETMVDRAITAAHEGRNAAQVSNELLDWEHGEIIRTHAVQPRNNSVLERAIGGGIAGAFFGLVAWIVGRVRKGRAK